MPRLKGKQVALDVGNFDGVLSGTDTDVQKAMETLDEIVAGGTPTKEFFVPVLKHSIDTTVYERNEGYFPTAAAASGESIFFAFHIPSDFVSLTQAVIVVVGNADEEIQWDLFSHYAAEGEAHGTHIHQTYDQVQNVLSGVIEEIPASGVLTNISAGDYVGIKLTSDMNYFEVMGLRIKYT